MVVATQLFAERGFDATTTAAIAAAAGVSEPILYRHFRSKQELFSAIVSEVTRVTIEEWGRVTQSSEDPAEAFRALAKQWPEHLKVCSVRYQVIHNALVSSRDPVVIETLRKFYTAMEAYFGKMISDGQAAGVFRRDIPTGAATWFLIERGVGYTLMTLSPIAPIKNADNDISVELVLKALMA